MKNSLAYKRRGLQSFQKTNPMFSNDLALVEELSSLQLDIFGKRKNIHAYSLHPGSILTPLQRHLSTTEMVNLGWIDDKGQGIDPSFKTPAQGASTATWAATSPELNSYGGVYCEDCEVAVIAHEPTFRGVRPYALDAVSAERLWALSARLTGVNAFA
ncbi:protochlorophyllide reductase [Paenibacillus forsythiae]|uniref:Protochlorophyllide reductase n=1 Tax=Paenibacillus forsythiae TaxID=365616 RepID=A0ABU3H4Y0_9BACL|nr:hypothetical protein [Paenibacillus forsythiae]MDT3425878.1 protochlorophyllide reductase [Paenibacillus forsythiae]